MFRLHSSHVPWLAGLAGATLTLAPLLALADTLPPVEVQAQRLRTEVSQVCPAIAQQLSDGLAGAIYQHGMVGDYRVSFTLHNDKVVQVSARGGHQLGERASIRRAMREVGCQDGASRQQPQQFAFILSVREDDGSGGQLARIGIGDELKLAQR